MSLPNFDTEVKLHSFSATTGITTPQIAKDFEVTGDIGDELQSHDFAVLVSIWQTEDDTGGSGPGVRARALGLGRHDNASTETKWTAQMSVQEGEFVDGRPATGVGLVVASNEDPTSFETYSWIRRLEIEVANSGTSPFE
jgi:hypothetical protein